MDSFDRVFPNGIFDVFDRKHELRRLSIFRPNNGRRNFSDLTIDYCRSN